MMQRIQWMAAALALGGTAVVAQTPPTSQSRTIVSRALPPMNGRDPHVKLVDVTYPPGGANSAHTHPCPVVGYVMAGALRVGINDSAEVIYKAGETFYEAPGDVHRIS